MTELLSGTRITRVTRSANATGLDELIDETVRSVDAATEAGIGP